MAQLVVAAAGAALGGFLAPGIVAFGMTGASIGWMAGSMLGSAFASTQKSSGPQLSDLSVSTSAYGTPIPYVAGHPRIAGQIVWASPKREIATTQEAGKGGGGSEYTTFTYEVDLLILLSDNEIAGVSRIWSNGDLTYTALASATPESLVSSESNGKWQRLTVYTGTSTQLPDPTYEAAVGTANAPAYRGRGAVFIQSLQLGSSGQIPNLTFEVLTNGVIDNYQVKCLLNFNEDVGSTLISNEALYNSDISNSGYGPGPDVASLFNSPCGGNYCNFYSAINPQYLVVNNTGNQIDFDFYAKDFCVEVYARKDIIPGNKSVFTSAYNDGTALGIQIGVNAGNFWYTSSGIYSITSSITASTNVWFHLAVTRQNNLFTFYIDGTAMGTANCSPGAAIPSTDLNWVIGGLTTSLESWDWSGAMDGFRVTHGTARYTQNFTPPAIELIDDSGLKITLSDPTLQSVVNGLLLRTGLTAPQFDTTALAAIARPVRSMAISSVSSARTVLDMLAQTYHFEAVLSDRIYFRPRATAPAATLTFNELGVIVDSGSAPDPLPLTQANELEIPAQMALTYSNVDGDYQTDTQYSDRLLTGQESTSAMQVPLGFTATEAKQIVDAMLLDKAVSALTTSVSLGVTRAALEPTDVVLLTGEDGSSYRMRIVKKAEASGVTTFDCVQDDSTVFTQTGTTAGGAASQTTVLATPTTTLELLDVPLLRDVDNLPGHYVAVKGSAANWTSAGLYDSLDDLTYTPNTTISSQAVIGTCTTTLATWAGGNVFDEVSSVTVNVGTQQLVSVTRDDILASQSTNAALIGGEVLQYRTATLVSAGVYTLGGFLRGQRGTVSTGHVAAERFIALASGGLRFIPLQQGDLGRLRYYKAASAGQKLSAVTSQSLTPAGITLKPFAPVNARANRNTADTVLTWTRQTRLSTRIVGTLGISSPLGESLEAYEVEIYTAGHAALLRTLTSATPTVTYTSAQQVTDFGSNQTALAVKIYQISATVGRGTPLTTTV